jgi:murein DD-endopeptidase MepM/ murein hydrolase activator NlpD
MASILPGRRTNAGSQRRSRPPLYLRLPVSPTEAGEIVALRGRDLKLPVDGVDRKDLRNTFADARGSRTHEALDILSPRGTKVRAVEDGRIQKLFTSKAGGLTIYEFDPTQTFAYYYAHLDRYDDNLREGQMVKRGDVIGYVGSTGNASPMRRISTSRSSGSGPRNNGGRASRSIRTWSSAKTNEAPSPQCGTAGRSGLPEFD